MVCELMLKNVVRPIAMLAALMLDAGAAPQPTHILPDGPLATSGSQIIGANHQSVRILSVGAFEVGVVSSKVDAVVAAGFNTIRVDWSNRSLHKAGFDQLDRVVAAAHRVHLRVILDDHSNEGDPSGPWKPCFAEQVNGLWYDVGGASDGTDGCQDVGLVSDAKFIEDWKTVAMHFRGNETIVGYDLWNEPSAYPGMSTWEPGSDNPDHNIRWMYERAGNAILNIDPSKLIICMGPMHNNNSFADPTTPAPWGDLSLAGKIPIVLSVSDRLVYAVHDYPQEIGGYKTSSGPEKVKQMTKTWGYLVRDHIAPVWIGEMGANMITEPQIQWFKTISDYANGHLGAEGGPVFNESEQGVGIDWWFLGHCKPCNPTGIFDADGSINAIQQAAYRKFTYRPLGS